MLISYVEYLATQEEMLATYRVSGNKLGWIDVAVRAVSGEYVSLSTFSRSGVVISITSK